jgi:hypothetical protein
MPIFSLVIPTRNRQRCAEQAIRIALQECRDTEVIVCDNSDTEELRERIGDLKDNSRLRYYYTAETLSVVDNFEKALQHVTGDYVMFLGDDDTVGPDIVEIVEWARSQGIETINYDHHETVLHYFWPGVTSKRWGESLGGSLVLSSFVGTSTFVDHRSDIVDALQHLGEGPRFLPRIYLGVVSRALLERIRVKYGRVFGGVSPDIFSSHLIAEESTKSAILDFPFVIPGASSSSTSAARAARTDIGSLRSTEHIQRFKDLQWDPRVPKFYSPHTVWAFSHLEAVRCAPRYTCEALFESLYAKCIIHSPGHLKAIYAAWKVWAEQVGLVLGFGRVISAMTRECVGTVARLMRTFVRGKPGGATFQYKGLSDTREALLALRGHLQEHAISPRLSAVRSRDEASAGQLPITHRCAEENDNGRP